jgi:hypothetical protein
MGQAVAAHLARDHSGERTTATCAHYEQVIGAAGGTNEDRASLAAFHDGLDRQ